MSVLSVEKPENISNLLALDQEYAVPEIVARSVSSEELEGRVRPRPKIS